MRILKNNTIRTKEFFAGRKTEAGFTLIEALIAIAVLLTAVAGPLTVASRSLSATTRARQQLIATYLAQEAVEFIRNERDNNSLSGADWLQDLDVCVDAMCRVDVPAGSVVSCVGDCGLVRFNDSVGLYGYNTTDGWEDTEFTREVTATSVNNREIEVTSTVSWDAGLITKSVTMKDTLHNWVE